MARPAHDETHKAYISIQKDILLGRIKTSAALKETELSERYGYTRSPLRQAIARLMHEGLAVETYYGIAVVSPSVEDLKTVIIARLAVESQIAWDLAHLMQRRAISVKPLRDIQTTLHSAKKKFASKTPPNDEERIGWLQADLSFHTTAAELAGYKLAVPIIRRTYFCNVVSINGAATVLPERATEIIDEHARLLEALEKGNATEAVKETKAHLLAAAERWFPFHEKQLSRDVKEVVRQLARD